MGFLQTITINKPDYSVIQLARAAGEVILRIMQ
jgi:hypothetical protein